MGGGYDDCEFVFFAVFVPLENSPSFGDVIIADEGLKYRTCHARHSWSLFSATPTMTSVSIWQLNYHYTCFNVLGLCCLCCWIRAFGSGRPVAARNGTLALPHARRARYMKYHMFLMMWLGEGARIDRRGITWCHSVLITTTCHNSDWSEIWMINTDDLS